MPQLRKKLLEAAKTNAEEQIADLKDRAERLTQLNERLPGIRSNINTAIAKLAELRERVVVLREKARYEFAEAERRKQEFPYPTEEEARRDVLVLTKEIEVRQKELDSRKAKAEADEQELMKVLSSRDAVQKNIDEKGGTTEEAAKERLDKLRARKAHFEKQKLDGQNEKEAINVRLALNQPALTSLVHTGKQLDEDIARKEWVDALTATANASLPDKDRFTLEDYVQIQYFDRIIDRANQRLHFLSDGQYYLIRSRQNNDELHEALELNVLDRYTGKERTVRSLSGGESFLASLALALGLSDEVQTQTGIAIDTMFVDEGFGTLDTEAIRTAIKVLEKLSGQNRQIGIISHVEELRERIPNQILVTKDLRTDGKSSGSMAEIHCG